MFTQIVDPVGNLGITCLVALIPVVLPLVLLAVFRISAWLAVLIGSVVTFVLATWIWQMPIGTGIRAYLYGSATGVWYVDWITFWGLVLFNTLGATGVFENFPPWACLTGHARHPGTDDAVRLGFRGTARGPRRFRLSVGGGGANPYLAAADGS